ncbi:hypothetical protein [Rhizobium sp. ICMP 5592]|uniref:hypothetical protein n=1 Tax=Rhizobium sp. ICMP 5592 TaxID=2292445 RepID=UPI0018866D9C|nr:hypothetical protein [Rhizobium sp. ICMP 5592]
MNSVTINSSAMQTLIGPSGGGKSTLLNIFSSLVVATEAEERALNAVGLAGFAGHFPRQLFAGMRRWVALARAISLDVSIILMDEPFTALGEQTRIVLSEDLFELLSRTGKTINFVAYGLGEAVLLWDRITIFSASTRHPISSRSCARGSVTSFPTRFGSRRTIPSIDARAGPEAPHDNRHLPCQAPVWRRDLARPIH